MRKLIIVRAVHTLDDMGSIGSGIRRDIIRRVGLDRWEESESIIDKSWDDIALSIKRLKLDYGKTKIYQDGLPYGGARAEEMVRKAADRGNKNYQIIRDLISKGATVEATESPRLLSLEYSYIKAAIRAKSDETRKNALAAYERIKERLLHARDRYIARKIDSSLKDGETGILFIGMAHDVGSMLPGDIEVETSGG